MIEISITHKNLTNFIKNIRLEDKLELEYVFKNNLEDNFIDSIYKCDEIYFLADNNRTPIAIGGVENRFCDDLKLGQVWLLTTKDYYKNRFYLYKYVLDKIKDFKTRYDILFNFIYKSNYPALTWLNKAGFMEYDLSADFKLFYFLNGGINFDIRYFASK